MANTTVRQTISTALRQAEADRRPIARLTETFPGLTLEDAYAIQTANIRQQVSTGARILGHKVGLTALVMQEMMGVDEPDFGHLLDTMLLDASGPVSLSPFIQPRIEVELAFVLAEALAPDCDEFDVIAATAYVVPCIELIDSRIENWDIGLIDSVADNGSAAGFIIGDSRFSPEDVVLDDIDAQLLINGIEVSAGSTRDVLGHPARSVAWLAHALADFGVTLEPGHVVLSGSCTAALDVSPGDLAEARFNGLGDLIVNFE